jgi:hypothetical protein
MVYADWLDEQNTPDDARLAAAQRWMAGRGRRPWDHGDEPANSPARWTWGSEEHGATPEPEYRLVPWRVFDGMAGHVNDFSWRGYPTRQEAERSLAEALATVAEGPA